MSREKLTDEEKRNIRKVIKITDLDGEESYFSDSKGKVVLKVNPKSGYRTFKISFYVGEEEEWYFENEKGEYRIELIDVLEQRENGICIDALRLNDMTREELDELGIDKEIKARDDE